MFLAELQQDKPALSVAPLDSQVAEALRTVPGQLVPDMPDRIIAATGLHLSLP